jgi:hypothetical protein
LCFNVATQTIGLRLDHARRCRGGTDANRVAQVDDLFGGEAELFGER